MMGPGKTTWFSSFGCPPLQPIEMLLFDHNSTSFSPPPPPPPPPQPHPMGDYFYHPISYAYHLFPPLPAAPVKFEDFLPPGTQHTSHETSPALPFGAMHGLHVVPAPDVAGCGSDSAEDDSSSAATGCNAGFVSSGRSTPDARHEVAISAGPLAMPVQATETVEDGGGEMTKAVTVAATPPAGAAHRTSAYRGVTRHRWTGRYEAHLWDNTCRREGQKRKGRQVYLGGYEREENAARAYDLAALKYWGPSATTNFPIITYEKEIKDMKCMTKQEFIASIRRNSSGFSRGASIYRGVTRHHQHGRWQARIGRVAGNKDLYLGTFATEEEAAEAYDVAAIKFRGANAVTNFELSRYDIEAITNTDLPIGSSAKRIKHSLEVEDNQLATVSLDSQHMNIVPSAFLHNLFQLGTPINGHCRLEEVDQDVYRQNLYLLTATDQHKGHIHNQQSERSGILQLIDFSPPQ